MATKTTNYNLIKPDLTDDADIRVINGNMDVLDNNLKQVSDSVTNSTNNLYSDITVTSDYTLKFTKGSGSSTTCDTIKNATEVKNTTGTARITAVTDNNINVFEVVSNSKYTFNGLTAYMNSSDDYFRFGGNDAYFRLAKDKSLISNTGHAKFNGIDFYFNSATDYFYFGQPNRYIAYNKDNNLYLNKGNGNQKIACYKHNLSFRGIQGRDQGHEGYVKFDDGLLIQWGCIYAMGTEVWNRTQNLPLPYANTGYVTMVTLTFPNDNHTINYDNRDIVYNQSESAIGVWSDTNNIVYWMTIGQGA